MPTAHSAIESPVSQIRLECFTFSFRTIWHDEPDVPATEVQYATSDDGWVDAYQKRSLGPTHLVSEQFYDNGTRALVKRRLGEEEVSPESPQCFKDDD